MKTNTRHKEKKLWRTRLFFILHFSFLILLFASCNNDDEEQMPGISRPAGQKIEFDIGFADEDGNRLKVSTDEYFKSSWDNNDYTLIHIKKIKNGNATLWCNDGYMGYTINNGWTLSLNPKYEYYPDDEDLEGLSFFSYSLGGDIRYLPYDTLYHIVRTDQRSESNYQRSDLMLATAQITKHDNPVQLLYRHAMAMVQIEVAREMNVPAFDETFTVTLQNVKTNVVYDITDKTLNTQPITRNVVMRKMADMKNTYRAVIPAQVLGKDMKVNFRQTTPGKEIDMTYFGLNSVELKSGKVEKHKVTLGYGIDPDHQYAIGDKYPHVGPMIGIVYDLEPGSDGKHGKVVGLHNVKNSSGSDASVTWADFNKNIATYTGNGLKNMQVVANYIKDNEDKIWSNFPAFESIHNNNDLGQTYDDENVKGVWYLPSVLELNTIGSRKGIIETALTTAGGTKLDNNRYWSSTELNGTSAIIFDFGSNFSDIFDKSTTMLKLRGVMDF